MLAPWIAPFDPTAQHPDAFLEVPYGTYLFGTDDLGRDIFSRVLYGARTSLLVAVCTLLAGGTNTVIALSLLVVPLFNRVARRSTG